MDLVSMLLNQGGGSAARQLAGNFGLTEEQAASAISSLVPALGQGLARNAAAPGGLESLLGALAGGGHERYVDNPSVLGHEDTVRDGNGILSHIFGSKDVSRQVAQQAAAQTGIGPDILKRMLPVVAAMMMGTLSRQAADPVTGQQGMTGTGLAGILGQFLDTNRDGSVIDDVLGMASRVFKP